MGALVSGLAHELNQPLNAIVNYAHGFARRAQDQAISDELLAATDRIVREAERASNVIHGLRRLVFRRDSVQDSAQVGVLVSNALDLCAAQAKQSEVEMRLLLADPLPTVNVDSVQIEQVILGLVVNAIESATISTKERWVEIESQSEAEEMVKVIVRDSGPGVSPDAKKKVFDPFYTTKDSGLGMGLAICRSIVEHHGGRIWCESPAGTGAEFSFTIPATTA